MALLALVLSACGSQKQPAQARIGEIEGAVSAAAGDASKYVPTELKEVQDRLSALESVYATGDYAAVLASSPAILDVALNLKAKASAAKSSSLKALNEQWAGLSQMLPAKSTALQKRIDVLGKQRLKRGGAGFDLDAAQATLADAASLWSKAQAAFASDNLNEAVSTANTVDRKLESLAASLQLEL